MTYGVSKNVTIYGVKVLGDDGAGMTSDIIGIHYFPLFPYFSKFPV